MVVKPIWEMLKKRFIGSEHFNKALTLEQYYTGTDLPIEPLIGYHCEVEHFIKKLLNIIFQAEHISG